MAREVVEALESRRALFRYICRDETNECGDRFEKAVMELTCSGGSLTGLISEDTQDTQSLGNAANSIHTSAEFKAEHKPVHKKVFVDYSSDTLLAAFSPVFPTSDVFKIVDPYIFEIKSESEAISRFEFVIDLAHRLKAETGEQISDKTIEVFGDEKYIFNPQVLRGYLSKIQELLECREFIQISLFALKSKPNNDARSSRWEGFEKKKLHDRYFYASDYLFQVEDTFQVRPTESHEQWVKFIEDQDERDYVRYAFSRQSPVFDITNVIEIDTL